MFKTGGLMKIYRQGDVLLKRVRSIPEEAKQQEFKERIVLAYGEVTGHAHAIHDLDNVDVLVTGEGAMYLRIKQAATLQHEEHGAITLPAGNYERVIQREYSPEAIRNVMD
jgi:galactokinase/mevalonate kinase-like predicted kinase